MPSLYQHGQHQALVAKREAIAMGDLRDCDQLQIVRAGRAFKFNCAASSFRLDRVSFAPDYVACPKDCLLFVDSLHAAKFRADEKQKKKQELRRDRLAQQRSEEKKERSQRRKKLRSDALWLVPRFFSWFGHAPWQTQLLIILLVLGMIAPRLLEPFGRMIALVFHGKVVETTTSDPE